MLSCFLTIFWMRTQNNPELLRIVIDRSSPGNNKGHAQEHGLSCSMSKLEARVGFEPTLTVLQTGS